MVWWYIVDAFDDNEEEEIQVIEEDDIGSKELFDVNDNIDSHELKLNW